MTHLLTRYLVFCFGLSVALNGVVFLPRGWMMGAIIGIGSGIAGLAVFDRKG